MPITPSTSSLHVSRETFSPPLKTSMEIQERLEEFSRLLIQWNSRINLISPHDIPNLWSRHIKDSLRLVPYIPPQSTITDLGSGGGFPGLVLAIATGLPVTLIESDQRKCAFLREASRICAAPTTIIAKRIEAVSLPPISLPPADIVTARALAPLDKLLDWVRPLLKIEGFCLFLKGKSIEDELTNARKNWHIEESFLPRLQNRNEESSDGVLLKISNFKRI